MRGRQRAALSSIWGAGSFIFSQALRTEMLVSALVGRLVGKLNEPARQLQPGMKGMGQVAAGSTGLIKQGNILISETGEDSRLSFSRFYS